MPRILKESTTELILKRGVKQPLPIPYVVTPRPLLDRFLGHSKLSTAADSDLSRNRMVVVCEVQVLKNLSKNLTCGLVVVLCITSGLFLQRAEFDWAAEQPLTAQIHVSFVLQVCESEVAE